MSTSPTAQMEGAGGSRAWVRLASAFWDGASKPSLGVVFAIALLALGQFGAIVVWLTPDRMAASDHGSWMVDPWDHSAYVTIETLRMQRDDPTELGVVIVGSSSLRHAFEDHFEFEKRLGHDVGAPVRLHFMPAGGQSLWESALLLDYLPEGFRGVVVIGVHPGRLVYDEKELTDWLQTPRVGLQSQTTTALREELGLPPHELTGFYALDNMAFLAARRTAILENLFEGPRPYAQHGRHINEPPSPAARFLRDSGAAEHMRHWEEGEQGGERGARALRDLVARLTSRGVEVIVAFSPLHPNVQALHPRALARFHSLVRQAATSAGARVADLDEGASLRATDFRDVFHVNLNGGRRRCEDYLAGEITSALRKVLARTGAEGAPS